MARLLWILRDAVVMRELDQWTRRRLRAIAWKQWRNGPNRFAELRRRGVGPVLAAKTASSPKGPWRLSNSPALAIALSNAVFKSLGLATVEAPKLAGSSVEPPYT